MLNLPHQSTAAQSGPAALAAFAALLHLHNAAFAHHRPKLLAGSTDVVIANWVLGIDATRGIAATFGPYLQCDPIARCVGCEAFCSTEGSAVVLSAKAGSRAVLMLERPDVVGAASSTFAIRTFVPRLPGQGGVFRPMINPANGEVVLVDEGRSLMATIEPDGHLKLVPLAVSSICADFGTAAALRMWKSMHSAGLQVLGSAGSGGQP